MLNKLTVLGLLGAIGSVAAQRPADVSICDYYTAALLTDNTAANQYQLLTLLVNTAVVGNYTQPSNGVVVPGILNPDGDYQGHAVNLLPYFDGGLQSTNAGPNPPACRNFLDGGGAAPLMNNKPADDTTSNQYFLLTHLYQYFGLLLGCSGYGTPGFPSYGGDPSQYNVHKYMDLDQFEIGYFITQVGLAAASFGVTNDDIAGAAGALNQQFGQRCSPAATVVPGHPALDSICQNPSCPLDATPDCAAYPNGGSGTAPATCPAAASSAEPDCSSAVYEAPPSTYASSPVYSAAPSTYAPSSVYSTPSPTDSSLSSLAATAGVADMLTDLLGGV